MNIIDVISEKSPLNFYNYRVKKEYRFEDDIVIIPLKLPHMIQSTPVTNDRFRLIYTFTQFGTKNGEVKFNLTSDSSEITVDKDYSRKIAEANGEVFFDPTTKSISSIYQSDLLVLVAKLPEQYKKENIVYYDDKINYRNSGWIGYNI